VIERRGLLHAELRIPGWPQALHCLCVHLGLFARGRRKQVLAVCRRIQTMVPDDSPLIVAGDFNDWQIEASAVLRHALHLHEVFELTRGRAARSFPAALPLLRLDRIYVRGLSVRDAHIHRGPSWARVSDHAVLSASVVPA
jgi:endonuclease/exonuclease/phosphatase family metal-dependent hydrolase